ncbi:hypothetical protein H6P81_016998 [Aristolochia fimbriata]|uniref:Pectinesterase inhibitor domain-containing protein n=1 Tax=Aristolochia fimbriata TaxID=158543 RepID=A0AAV7DYP0_ARIFI|nr:hypothetical protein H6P81_016998 [Aristolochia fimbriata]
MAARPVLLLLLLCFLPLFFAPTSSDLQAIKEVCSYTTHEALCVAALLSDPNSAAADYRKLAQIALDLSFLNASDNTLFTQRLLDATKDYSDRVTVRVCLDFYEKEIVPHMKEAEEYIYAHDYDKTINEMAICIVAANNCGDNLGRGGMGRSALAGRTATQVSLCEITQVLLTLLRY